MRPCQLEAPNNFVSNFQTEAICELRGLCERGEMEYSEIWPSLWICTWSDQYRSRYLSGVSSHKNIENAHILTFCYVELRVCGNWFPVSVNRFFGNDSLRIIFPDFYQICNTDKICPYFLQDQLLLRAKIDYPRHRTDKRAPTQDQTSYLGHLKNFLIDW